MRLLDRVLKMDLALNLLIIGAFGLGLEDWEQLNVKAVLCPSCQSLLLLVQARLRRPVPPLLFSLSRQTGALVREVGHQILGQLKEHRLMNQKIFRRTFRPLLMSLPFVFAAGCAVDEGVTDEVLASDGDRSVNSTTVSSETNASEPTSDIFDGDVSVIVDDLNRFWEEADEELGFDYEPVDQSRVSTGTDGAVCNSVPIDPEEVEGNAYVDSSCAEGITVAYDPEYLGNSLAKAEATMAHEWGHVVQAQAAELDLSLDPEGLPIDAELQADCFAGAWAAERALAEIDNLGEDVFKSGDADDVEIDDPHAHGTPEERELSFQVGLEGGPAACIDDLVDTLP